MLNVDVAALTPGGGTDLDLVARVLAGDRVAGRAVYDIHAPTLHRLALRLTRDPDLAQDCVQDAFVRAFANLHTYRGDAALGTWLYRVTLSVTLNAMRKRSRWWRRSAELGDAEPMAAESREGDPELRDRLHAAIDALPEIYRTVVVLHDIEDRTHAEIADALGVPVGTCKARLSVARAKLRATLERAAREWLT